MVLVKEWEHEGLKCLIRRHNTLGHLCGYVVLPEGHYAYEKDYDDIDVDVHGGLTYANMEDGKWVVGFDCAHLGDYVPGSMFCRVDGEHEWTVDEVEKETNQLARQLARKTVI